MDNATHTLVGLLVGEAAACAAARSDGALPVRLRRDVLVVTLVVGSNAPDADLLYSAATRDPLDYPRCPPCV